MSGNDTSINKQNNGSYESRPGSTGNDINDSNDVNKYQQQQQLQAQYLQQQQLQQHNGNNYNNSNMNSAITERLINNFLYQFSQNNNVPNSSGNGSNSGRHNDSTYSNQTNNTLGNTGFVDGLNSSNNNSNNSNNNNLNYLYQQQKLQQQMMSNNNAFYSNGNNNNNSNNVNQILDPQAILNMNWLQQYNQQMAPQQTNTNNILLERQQQQQQQHNNNNNNHLQQQQPQLIQQVPTSSSSSSSSASSRNQLSKSKLVQDLSLLTQQQINQISPLLQVSANGTLSSAQFKNETRTQKRVTKRKSLLKMGPKRPSSAYFFYCQHVRPDLQKSNPQMKVPEMQKKMGQDWKKMSDEEKEPYKKEQRDAWEVYKKAKAEYENKLPPKKPSGPFVAYVIDQKERFAKENRDKGGKQKLTLTEMTAMCVEEWKNLDEQVKLKYNLSFKEKIKDWKEAYEKLESIERDNRNNENNINNNSNDDVTQNIGDFL